MATSADIRNSSYRELLIEHLLVGEMMRLLWLKGITQFEVLQPQVDDSGYDLVLEANGFVRHIQLKASFNGAATKSVKASLRLMSKPSACVVWTRFDSDSLKLGPFYFFGNEPGQPMPDISSFPIAKMTRGDSKGKKKERPLHRVIRQAKFEKLATCDDLTEKLFGKFKNKAAAV